MDATTRRTRFENRVLLERDFLSRVNAIFGQAAPLTGMTIGAIESWTMRAVIKTEIRFRSGNIKGANRGLGAGRVDGG